MSTHAQRRLTVVPESPMARRALVDSVVEVGSAVRAVAEETTAAYAGMRDQRARLRESVTALRSAWRSRHEEPTQ